LTDRSTLTLPVGITNEWLNQTSTERTLSSRSYSLLELYGSKTKDHDVLKAICDQKKKDKAKIAKWNGEGTPIHIGTWKYVTPPEKIQEYADEGWPTFEQFDLNLDEKQQKFKELLVARHNAKWAKPFVLECADPECEVTEFSWDGTRANPSLVLMSPLRNVLLSYPRPDFQGKQFPHLKYLYHLLAEHHNTHHPQGDGGDSVRCSWSSLSFPRSATATGHVIVGSPRRRLQTTREETEQELREAIRKSRRRSERV